MNHPPDEILSALVDHEAVDAVDAAHVDECAACQARVDAFRRVAAAVAAPVAPPAGHVREAAVASALVETTGASGAVRRLATARRARAKQAAGSARRISTASAAAALLVALGVGGWLLSQSGGEADNKQAAKAGTVANRSANAQTQSASGLQATTTAAAVQFGNVDAASGGTGTAGVASASGFYDAGDIGEHTATDTVIARYRDYLAGETDEHGSYKVTPPCPKPDDRDVVWHASLTYNGIPAYARVLRASPSDQILEIRAQADCALVESQAI